jgi:hypothetical protein
MLRGLPPGARGASIILLATFVATARCVEALPDDPTGAWKLKCVPPDGKARECIVIVAREGKSLQGTYSADGVKRAVKEIAFDRGILSVRVDGEFAGQSYGLTYRGKPAGDTLCGTVRWSYGWASGSFAFEGERIAQTVATDP